MVLLSRMMYYGGMVLSKVHNQMNNWIKFIVKYDLLWWYGAFKGTQAKEQLTKVYLVVFLSSMIYSNYDGMVLSRVQKQIDNLIKFKGVSCCTFVNFDLLWYYWKGT